MSFSSQAVLMCPPDYFGVEYIINPWMQGHVHTVDRLLAHHQWNVLCAAVAEKASVALLNPKEGLPDLVFTANAGFVFGKKVIVSRFRNAERRGEENLDRAWFEKCGFEIVDWPEDTPFEGAGDALFDRGAEVLWVGSGFRTIPGAASLLEKKTGRKTILLTLADKRFYHLDTCLCPLAGGYAMYYPAAFTAPSREMIEALVPEDERIPVSEEDALLFCCNAVELGDHIFLNGASAALEERLRGIGLTPVITPLSEFMKSGGSAKCLTLKLIDG